MLRYVPFYTAHIYINYLVSLFGLYFFFINEEQFYWFLVNLLLKLFNWTVDWFVSCLVVFMEIHYFLCWSMISMPHTHSICVRASACVWAYVWVCVWVCVCLCGKKQRKPERRLYWLLWAVFFLLFFFLFVFFFSLFYYFCLIFVLFYWLPVIFCVANDAHRTQDEGLRERDGDAPNIIKG